MFPKTRFRQFEAYVAIFLLGFSAPAAIAVDPLSSAQIPAIDAQVMANLIVDPASDLTFVPGSATTAINTGGAPESSNPRATGIFINGLTTPGTLLPAENQPDPMNPTASYSGGIGADFGVCLSTGLLSDDDAGVDPMIVPDGLGVGIQGPNNGFSMSVDF